MAGKKGQKFDRNRKRSKAHARYNMERRWEINKGKKMRRHSAAHPKDKQVTTVIAAGGGQPVEFPRVHTHHNKAKPEGLNDLDVEYRAHHIVHMVQNGKKKKVVVLDEAVASSPIFCVEGEGVTQTRSVVEAEADALFNKSHGACALLVRTGDKVKVLKNKRATPPKGFEGQFRNFVDMVRHAKSVRA
jgi:hypothetical protein